jgi:hypothetical protein
VRCGQVRWWLATRQERRSAARPLSCAHPSGGWQDAHTNYPAGPAVQRTQRQLEEYYRFLRNSADFSTPYPNISEQLPEQLT